MTKSPRFQALKALQRCAVILLAFPLLISMSPTALAGWCNLHIRNSSRYKIHGIYMSHTGKNHWSGNLLDHDDHDDEKHNEHGDDHRRGDRNHSEHDENHDDDDKHDNDKHDEHYIDRGQAVSMRYEYEDNQCYYDMKVVSEQDPEGEIHPINLCKTTAYEITDDEYGGSTQSW